MQSECESSPRIHRTLSGDFEFRLVILLPSPNFESALECRLEHAIIGKSKPYEALSYVWGSPHFTESITLDGQEFMITPRLEGALRYLRLPGEERALWIDAICINQQDLAERREQVGYMRRIYNSCSSDILWLGPGNKDYSRGMEAIRILAGLVDEESKVGHSSSHTSRLEKSLKKPKRGAQTVIEKLLDRDSVWKRVWIMQEISCSPKVILTCGNETLDWSLVEAVVQGGLHYTDAFHGPFGHGTSGGTDGWAVMFGTAKLVTNQRETMAKIQDGEESTLLDVLARFKHTESTDPRDKVYALLGLVSNTLGVEADYTKCVVETYVGVTRTLINSSANLDILCQCPWKPTYRIRNLPLLEGLPNWVPDFRTTQDGRYLFAQRGIYSAGRPTCSVPCIVQGSDTIWLNGCYLGRLQASKGAIVPNTEEERKSIMYPVILRDWARKNLSIGTPGTIVQQKYRTGEDQLQAFWRTLVGDCAGYPQRRLTSDDIAHDQIIVEKLIHQRAIRWSDFNMQSHTMLDKLVFKEGWRFYTLDNGLFVLAQYKALAGDVIAILDGAKTPMVLRPTGVSSEGNESYWPIGGAYVHGFMDGEVLKLENEFEERVFRIV